MTIVASLPWVELLIGLSLVLAGASSLRFFFPALATAPVALPFPIPAFHNPVKSFPPQEERSASLRSKEVYRNLVEDFFREGHVGAIFFSQDLKLQGMNASARALLGNFQDDWTGRPCREALPEAFAATVEDCWRDKLNLTAGPVAWEAAGGKKSSINAHAMLLRDRDGDFYGTALFVWEGSRTSREGYPQELSDEIRKYKHLASVGVHAAAMAHEIKNPLVALKTFAELLPSKYDDKEFRDTFSKIALNQITRLDSIVNDLLDWAKPRKPLLKRVNPMDILQEAVDVLAMQAKEKKIQVRKMDYKGITPLMLDAEQLRRVFLNLILNAIEAMPKGGKLTITSKPRSGRGRLAESRGPELEICIADTGPGIAPEDLEHIFEPFYTTKKKGSGLGLAISRRIVEDHGGSIEFKSGKTGTLCVITLPQRREKQAASRLGGAGGERRMAKELLQKKDS